jgi:E3 ubiquitin-protein ligase synoviolin
MTYLIFFVVILLNYGLPLHILRDVYMTCRSFVSRCDDLIRYRRATRDMDALYPDATPEEMDRLGDKTCIICREEMAARGTVPIRDEQDVPGPDGTGQQDEGGPNETPKMLACGHVFHFHCLRSWLERQQSCPTW